MAKDNPFATAEGRRIEITNEQTKQIRNMYKDVKNEFADKVRILSNKTNVSSIMRTQYLKDFQKDLEADIKFLNKQLEKTIETNALRVAEAVVDDSNKLNEAMGFRGIFTNDYYIPHQAVESIITGQLYDGKWTLSKAIWSDNQKKLNDINEIVSKGMIANKSTYDIAKDLERYVNPRARKDWEWSKVYPHTSKKIDYNAQRLARTMVSHAYQESFVRSTRENPFIDSYRWLASGSDRMCDVCAERDGKIFSKDELPLDHPNGMCTFEAVISKSYDEIARDLRNWVDDKGSTELNEQLNGFADSLGYNVKDWTGDYVKSLSSDKIDTTFKNFFVVDNTNKIDTPEKFMEKWNVPMKGITSSGTIRNLDEAMQFTTSTYNNLDLSKCIRSIKNEKNVEDNAPIYYGIATRNILIREDYAKDLILPASSGVHDIDHAVQGYIAKLESSFNNSLGIVRVGREIVSDTFSDLGYDINPETNLPYKKDVKDVLTTYAFDNLIKKPNECLSEASRLIYLKDIENEVEDENKMFVARALHDKERNRLEEDLLKRRK